MLYGGFSATEDLCYKTASGVPVPMEVVSMKKWLRVPLFVLLIALLLGCLYGCKQTDGLQENDEWNNNPSVISRNRELAHIRRMSYASLEEALANDYKNAANYLSLNGTWSFNLVTETKEIPGGFMTPSFDVSGWKDIQVPGNWELQGFSAPTYTYASYPWNTGLYTPAAVPEKNEIGLYRREIDVPADWKGKEIFISFDGVESACYVYVNGKMVGYGEDSYTSKDFRITSYLNYGEKNTIAVKVFKYSDGSWLEAQDSLKLGGIFRDVYLYATPKTEIKDATFTYKFTSDFSSAILYSTVDIGAYDSPVNGSYVQVSLYDADGKEFLAPTKIGGALQYGSEKSGGAYLASATARTSVSGMRLWSAEDPYLYTAVIGVYDGSGNLLDMISTRIGFRDVSFSVAEDGSKVLSVNGKHAEFFGVNYNEHSSVNGKAITREEMIEDILTLKKMNCNAVRSAGTPLSPEFISLCDEYGLYVISELNIETEPWAFREGQSLPGNQAIWQKALIDRLNNVLERDKNSASVVIWSLGNQAGIGSNLSTVRNWLISNDSRLIVYNAYYSEDGYGNVDFNVIGDIISTSGWDVGMLNAIASDDDVTAPIFITDLESGLLSGGGLTRYYMDLMDKQSKVQGVFLSFFKDRSLKLQGDLQYPASWIQDKTLSDAVVMALSGLIGSDGTWQSDAYELQQAYAAIGVSPLDLKAGTFRVINRNAFTAFEDVYTLSYEVVRNGKTVVRSGTVDGLTLQPGETKTITLDYGTYGKDADYFVTVTVSYKEKPTWADDGYDGVVSSVQYDLTGNTKPVKNNTEAVSEKGGFDILEFIAPVVDATDTGLAAGRIYVTNRSSKAFDEMFRLSYQVLEYNRYWNEPRWYVYTSGTVNTSSVGAGSSYVPVSAGYHVRALEGAQYRVIFTVTVKQDIGTVKAGTEIVYEFNASRFGLDSLPFEVDASRTPVPKMVTVVDANGKEKQTQEKDADGHPMWIGGPFDDADRVYTEKPEGYGVAQESFLILKNANVEISLDPASGLLLSYKVNGKEMLAESDKETVYPSLLLSLMRKMTGGDYCSDVSDAENLESLRYASSYDGKQLKDALKPVRISDGHYRLTLSYDVLNRDASHVKVDNTVSSYQVVYDIYADGTICVSAAIRLNMATGTPTEIANILALDSSLSNVTWYGRGPGETYADKKYNSRVSVFENISAEDLIDDLYLSGGDRSETRWVAFTDEDGDGLLITSDDNLFAFNVSKEYAWENNAYGSNLRNRPYNLVRVVGVQRGVSAVSSENECYLDQSYAIDPGSVYRYSFRISPLKGADSSAMEAKASAVVSTAGKASVSSSERLGGKTFALENLADLKKYLTGSSGDLSVSAATGSASQFYKRIFTNIVTVSGEKNFVLQNLRNGLYLTPSEVGLTQSAIELGFAARDTSLRWQSWYQNKTELTGVNTEYVLAILARNERLGARLGVVQSEKEDFTAFSVIVDASDNELVRVRSNMNNLYVTAVDQLVYANPIVQEYDTRRMQYPLSTDWGVFHAPGSISYDYSSWVELLGRAVMYDALPGESQQWTFVATSDGNYRIANKKTGYLLGVEGTFNPLTQKTVYEIVETDPLSDFSDISNEWKVEDLGGYYRVTNVGCGLVLQTRAVRGFLSKTERDYRYITDINDAIEVTFELSLGEWKGTAEQKWHFYSEKDLEVRITAGSDWLEEE